MGHLSSSTRRLYLLVGALFVGAALLAGVVAGCVARASARLVSPALVAGAAATAATLGACGLVSVVLLAAERRRRARIVGLAEQVDLVLRDVQTPQRLSDYEEGELALLANELQKMSALLCGQADALRAERDRLADALADISHQLRTPLMSMNLTLELLGRADIGVERRRALLRDLRRLTDNMGWLVTSLLTLARADAGTLALTRAHVDVPGLIEAAVAPLRIAFELADVSLEVSCATGAESFEGDAGWSTEALANVVKNCLEHTPRGGSVRVTATSDVIAARIVVCDSGPGIAPADLPHIFERFYKGDGSAPQSVGIGLALARCLVNAQGATVSADNSPQGGARFTFTFPHVATV